MKKNILLLSLLVSTTFAFGQNVVTTTSTTTPSSCDGEAQADTTGLLSWNWTDEANNLIQSGGLGLSNLCTGNYILNYTNINGLYSDTFNIDVSACYGFSAISALTTTPTIGNQCNGSLTVDLINAQFYTVDIYSDSNNLNVMTLVVINGDLQTTNMFCAGNYSMTVTDSAGCVETASFTIMDLCASLQSTPTILFPSSGINCDGSILLTTTGGTPPYIYSWSSGDDSSYVPELCPGSYVATVIDMNGCILDLIIDLTDTSGVLSASLNTTDATADGVCDGSVTLTIDGGIAPYTILHSTGDTTGFVGNLCEGIYSVWISDQANDSVYLTYLISNPSNTIYNYTYGDSIVVDSLFNDLVVNCTIDYNNVDSAFIGSANILASDSVTITWEIYSNSGVSYITETYYFGGGNGVYSFSVAMYCPQRSIGEYLKVYDQLYLDGSLGLTEETLSDALVFPNPFSETLSVILQKQDNYTIRLTDMAGRLVFEQSYEQTDTIVLTDLNTYSSGNYLLSIKGTQGLHIYKLVK